MAPSPVLWRLWPVCNGILQTPTQSSFITSNSQPTFWKEQHSGSGELLWDFGSPRWNSWCIHKHTHPGVKTSALAFRTLNTAHFMSDHCHMYSSLRMFSEGGAGREKEEMSAGLRFTHSLLAYEGKNISFVSMFLDPHIFHWHHATVQI